MLKISRTHIYTKVIVRLALFEKSKMLRRVSFFLLLIWLCSPCLCLPPRLNITEDFVVDIRQRQSFSISCEGTEELHWNWTSMISIEDGVISVENEEHPGSEYPFVSTLTIFSAYVEDTGFYRCHYAGVSNFVTDEDNVASSYVYVYDGQTGLVYTGFTHQQVTTSEKLVLDCRPTLPNITVTLYKDSVEIEPGRYQWHPRVGFVLRRIVIQDSGTYTCKEGKTASEHTFFVNVSPQQIAIPKPAMEWELNQHFVVGYSFSINCSVLINKDIIFHWTLPNSLSNYTTETTTLKRKNSIYRVGTLHMYNATKKDSGFYRCEVTTSGMSPNEESREIVVKETLKHYVNLTSVPMVSIKEGEFLKWKVDIRAFPPNPMITYFDWKGKKIIETDRITSESDISAGVCWLKIENITVADFGNYTIKAVLPDGSYNSSLTVSIEVASKPYPKIMEVPPFYDVNKQIKADCKTRGFPIGNTKWTYKVCPSEGKECSGTSGFETLLLKDNTSAVLPPGNIYREIGSFNPEESGLLKCEVENENGKSSDIVSVPISDIGGNLVMRHFGENSITTVKDHYDSVDVVVNDDKFELLCGASKFFFMKVELVLPDDDLKVQLNETKFSRQAKVAVPKVTKDLGGTYRCTGTGYLSSRGNYKELHVSVKDEEEVMFINSNMDPDGSEIAIKENDEMYLNCTVRGSPPPTVMWFKDDYPLLPDDDLFDGERVFLRNNMQTIYFKYPYKEIMGTYSCTAQNRLNEITGYLTISAPNPGLTAGAKAGLVLALIGIAVLIIVVVVLVKRVKKERKFRKSFRQNELYLFEKGNVGQLNPDCTADEQAELLPYDPMWEVERDSINIGKQLGAGAFGRVVKAVVAGLEDDKPSTTVAVKMCKSQADQSQVRALALELKIMIHLGKHLNIVNLMGANTVHIGKGELWILVEYCRFGNLLAFMHKHRQKFVNQIDPITGNIDLTKTVPDAISPFSPTSHTSGSRYHTTPVTDVEGYLAPTASKFNLASPPIKKQPPPYPQSSGYMTGSTDSSTRSDGSSGPNAHNPMYSMLLQRSVSENPEGEPMHLNTSGANLNINEPVHNSGSDAHLGSNGRKPRLDSITSLERERRQRMDSLTNSEGSGKRRLQSASLSDTGSVGYCREGGNIVNTDMTTVPLTTTTHLSPLSPTDSNHLSEYGVDSKGNPFYYECGQVPAVTAPFTTSELVCWAWQVAQGMDYLSQRKVLHGDLAARNLLLADNNVIKISDFGLSREMYKKDVYMKKGDDLMPIKWMAVEAIRDRIFSVQSDIWAYGVTLWEIFSLGSTPYPGIEVNKDFLTLIEEGYRMDKPKFANRPMYDILLKCWDADPRQRPTFAQAGEFLGDLMLPDLRGQYMNMNDPYLRMNEERFRSGTDYLNMLASPNFDAFNKDDDARVHYVNVGDVSDEKRDSNYLDMKGPNSVGYSRIGFNPSLRGPAGSSPGTPQSHYLPMGSCQDTPSPMVDVFSPRPNEVPHFTFGPNSPEKSPRLAGLPEEDERSSSRQGRDGDNVDDEKSSLISSDSRRSEGSSKSDKKPVTQAENSLCEIPVDESNPDCNAFYVNLPTHGVDYANL